MEAVQRDWGHYEVLADGKGWKLKMLTLKPGKATSEQRHKLRGEVWVFVEDSMRVEVHPKGQWHQLKNHGFVDMKVLELQYGEQCIEFDIERKD